MKKITYLVQDIVENHRFQKVLRVGIVVSFLFMTSSAIASTAKTSPNHYKIRETRPLQPVVTLSSSETATDSRNAGTIEIFARDNYTSSFRTELAFTNLIERYPKAIEMEPVVRFIADGIGNINVERVAVDYDARRKVLNVAYRLPGDILVSIMKPLSTMDDNYVMFNVYHLRDLLISDMTSIGTLSKYIRSIESHYAEQV